MKCTDLLIQDHKIILRALEVLQAMSDRAQKNETVPAEDVAKLLHFLRAFADDYHQGKEESALFPALPQTSLIDFPTVRFMIFEHNQERSLVEGLEEALHTKKGGEFAYFANRLNQFLKAHIEKEDVMFEIINRSVSAEQDERITSEFATFQLDSKLLADLQLLERKYLKRDACA
jgi:hemerythrin-like domain-containing protein